MIHSQSPARNKREFTHYTTTMCVVLGTSSVHVYLVYIMVILRLAGIKNHATHHKYDLQLQISVKWIPITNSPSAKTCTYIVVVASSLWLEILLWFVGPRHSHHLACHQPTITGFQPKKKRSKKVSSWLSWLSSYQVAWGFAGGDHPSERRDLLFIPAWAYSPDLEAGAQF